MFTHAPPIHTYTHMHLSHAHTNDDSIYNIIYQNWSLCSVTMGKEEWMWLKTVAKKTTQTNKQKKKPQSLAVMKSSLWGRRQSGLSHGTQFCSQQHQNWWNCLVHTQTHAHTEIHLHIHTCTQTHTHTHSYTCTLTWLHTCAHIHTLLSPAFDHSVLHTYAFEHFRYQAGNGDTCL